MKNLIMFLALTIFSTAFAGQTLIPMEDDMVPASLVINQQNVVDKDDEIAANIVTVFRGSAAGVFSAIVTFAESLEDASYSYEFDQLLDSPKNASLQKLDSNVYLLEFDAVMSDYNDIDDTLSSKKITIRLRVTKENARYSVERL